MYADPIEAKGDDIYTIPGVRSTYVSPIGVAA